MQAVSQTDVVNAFIDEAWVTFVYNLNILLRTVQNDAVYAGVRSLMKFLVDTQNTKDLGGLVVQFCTFENELEVDENDAAVDATANANDAAAIRPSSEHGGLDGSNTGDDNQQHRDSFAENTGRHSRASRGENWFFNLGDVLGRGNNTATTNNTNNRFSFSDSSSRQSSSHKDTDSGMEIDMADLSKIYKQDSSIAESPSVRNVAGSRGVSAFDRQTASSAMSAPSTSSRPSSRHHVETDTNLNTAANAQTTRSAAVNASWCGRFWDFLTSLITFPVLSFARFLLPDFCNPRAKRSSSSTSATADDRDFIETCDAIANGRLSMGLLVFHPKVVQDVYIIQPEDFASDPEDDVPLLEEESREMIVERKNPHDRENSDEEDPSNSKSAALSSTDANLAILLSATKTADVPIPRDRSNSAASDTSLSGSGTLLSSYGARADEMARFYKIMIDSESGGESSSVPSSHHASFSGSYPRSSNVSNSGVPVLSPSVFPLASSSTGNSRNTSFSTSMPLATSAKTSSGNEALSPVHLSPMHTRDTTLNSTNNSNSNSPDRPSKRSAKKVAVVERDGYSEFSSSRTRSVGMPLGRSSVTPQHAATAHTSMRLRAALAEARLERAAAAQASGLILTDDDIDGEGIRELTIGSERKQGDVGVVDEAVAEARKKALLQAKSPRARQYSVFNARHSRSSSSSDGSNNEEQRAEDGEEDEAGSDGDANEGDVESTERTKRRTRKLKKSKRIIQEDGDVDDANADAADEGVGDRGNDEEDGEKDNESPQERDVDRIVTALKNDPVPQGSGVSIERVVSDDYKRDEDSSYFDSRDNTNSKLSDDQLRYSDVSYRSQSRYDIAHRSTFGSIGEGDEDDEAILMMMQVIGNNSQQVSRDSDDSSVNSNNRNITDSLRVQRAESKQHEPNKRSSARLTTALAVNAARHRSRGKPSQKSVANLSKQAMKRAAMEARRLAEAREQRLKRRQEQLIALEKRADLAPSGFQHRVRAWRLSTSLLQGGICDGTLGYPVEVAPVSNPTPAVETVDLEANQQVVLSAKKPEDLAHDGDDEDDEDCEDEDYDSADSSGQKKKMMAWDIEAPLATDSADRYRDSFLPAAFFQRMTFSGRQSSRSHSSYSDSSASSSHHSPNNNNVDPFTGAIIGNNNYHRNSSLAVDGSSRESMAVAAYFKKQRAKAKIYAGSSSASAAALEDAEDVDDKQLPSSTTSSRPLSLQVHQQVGSSTSAGDANKKHKSNKGSTNKTKKKKSGMSASAAIQHALSRRRPKIDSSTTTASDASGVTASSTYWSTLYESSKARFRLAYINHFYTFHFVRFMVGYNVFPYGPSYLLRLIELPLFLLSLSDCILWVLILSSSLCVSNDATRCSDHLAFNLMISVWPMAFIIAPITGMIAIVLGPSASLARIYAMFSRLAGINNLVLIIVVIQYFDYYYSINKFSIWPVVALTGGRLFQTFAVDLYIAHIEKLRYTRGWDGLHTSLFKTRDNKAAL